MEKALLAVAIFLLSAMFILWWPMAIIWSLNTLFSTDIPYSLNTWAAVLVLVTIIRIASLSRQPLS